MADIALIIPFFNERLRLKTEKLLELSQLAGKFLDIYLIDDGSTDDYFWIIKDFILKAGLNNVALLRSEKNLGKAEAIRFGASNLNLSDYNFLGIADADFSAPPAEVIRLARLAIGRKSGLVFGIRKTNGVNLIKTSRYRFLQGVVFTKIVSGIIGRQFLDSQCGLKYFEVNSGLIESLKVSFTNPWLFDIEMLYRLSEKKKIIVNEIYLEEWSHMKNSKTSIKDITPVIKSLILLRWNYGKIKNIKLTTLSL